MIELKKDLMETIDKINIAWVRAIKEGSAEGSDGIDVTDVMGEYSKLMTELDAKWNEGMLRIKNKKGKFF